MKDSVSSWCSDDFATETIDDVGETTYEEKVYYEKVGEEAEKLLQEQKISRLVQKKFQLVHIE